MMYSTSNKEGHLNYHTLPVISSKTLYTYINTTNTNTFLSSQQFSWFPSSTYATDKTLLLHFSAKNFKLHR